MKDSTIARLRGVLIRKLLEYEGKPVKLDLPSDILEAILFEYRSHWNEKYKVFARDLTDYEVLPCDILHKIDFTGVSFKDFECCNLTKRYVGITLNPQEVYRKDLAGVNLDGIILELDNEISNPCTEEEHKVACEK